MSTTCEFVVLRPDVVRYGPDTDAVVIPEDFSPETVLYRVAVTDDDAVMDGASNRWRADRSHRPKEA